MISFYATFNGKKISLLSWDVAGGAYGTVSSAQIKVSGKWLIQNKVDLYKISGDVSGSVEVYIFLKDGSAAAVNAYGGVHNFTEWDFDTDIVTIHVRGWEELIADQRRVMTGTGKQITAVLQPLALGQTDPSKGISTQNQKISQIVTSIANLVGLTPVITEGTNDQTKGTQYSSADRTFFAAPQNLWMVLCELARDTGNIVYTTADKKLVFAPPGTGLPTMPLAYNRVTSKNKAQPTRRLHIKHQPRRNGTFRVQVQSYSPVNEQVTVGMATAIGGNRTNGDTLKAGVTQGTAAQAVDKQLAGLKGDTGFSQVPLYVFHYDGLTADQANAKAYSIACDIAKHELILTCEITGFTAIYPGMKITLDNGSGLAFGDTTFYVTDYTHSFILPRSEGSENSGIQTRIVALNIATEGLARDNSG